MIWLAIKNKGSRLDLSKCSKMITWLWVFLCQWIHGWVENNQSVISCGLLRMRKQLDKKFLYNFTTCILLILFLFWIWMKYLLQRGTLSKHQSINQYIYHWHIWKQFYSLIKSVPFWPSIMIKELLFNN